MEKEKEVLYSFTHKLLPFHSKDQLTQLCARLPRLLAVSAQEAESQFHLALDLGQRFITFSENLPIQAKLPHLVNAMHYFSQALRMGPQVDQQSVKSCHRWANRIFTLIIREHLVANNQFQASVDESVRVNNVGRLEDHEIEVRLNAIWALGRVKTKDPKIHRHLAQMLADQDSRIRARGSLTLNSLEINDEEIKHQLALCQLCDEVKVWQEMFRMQDNLHGLAALQLKKRFKDYQ